MIYRTMVFGHRKCSRGYRVLIGSPERSFGHPRQRYGPYGPSEGTHQPWCAPIEASPMRRRRKEGRARKVWIRIPTSFPLPHLSFHLGYIWQGARGLGGTPSRIPPTWAPPMAAPPSLPPIYTSKVHVRFGNQIMNKYHTIACKL